MGWLGLLLGVVGIRGSQAFLLAGPGGGPQGQLAGGEEAGSRQAPGREDTTSRCAGSETKPISTFLLSALLFFLKDLLKNVSTNESQPLWTAVWQFLET